MKPTEHEIQQAIINYLRVKGWYVQRLNSGRIPIGVGAKKRLIMLADKGTPDIMAFRTRNCMNYGCPAPCLNLIFIEVKKPGKKPTFNQEQMMQELERYGARCIVAHSVEEIQELSI